jgi:hypothetical protein
MGPTCHSHPSSSSSSHPNSPLIISLSTLLVLSLGVSEEGRHAAAGWGGRQRRHKHSPPELIDELPPPPSSIGRRYCRPPPDCWSCSKTSINQTQIPRFVCSATSHGSPSPCNAGLERETKKGELGREEEEEEGWEWHVRPTRSPPFLNYFLV